MEILNLMINSKSLSFDIKINKYIFGFKILCNKQNIKTLFDHFKHQKLIINIKMPFFICI
ncbi:hypothetical protein BpHYR1_007776 [Brachionus plicatilis]|uniref:Uncharacterized protein n=1 Tax=Brachionus plicatilis TaxID=10195 RepID=A0A3M7SY76_BRAPC|nr:hypothetical protein BpHYR1_007776 [Brachionus plicatilis]